jgi:PPM family protein phosphatase
VTALRWAAVTDVGRVRPHNEDEVLADGDDLLFAVADGMGGHAAGEVASEVAIAALKRSFEENPTADGLSEAVREANRAVWERAHQAPEFRGMGTTMTTAALLDVDGEDRLVVANVGDSRGYLMRDSELAQLTEDHSLVEELVRTGRLAPEDAATHPQKHILTRVLGMEDRDGNPADIEVDVFEVVPFRGDRLLLASDGLTNELTDEQIATVLRRIADSNDAASELVRQARAAGGNDNISVVIIDVVDDGDKAQAASAALAGEPPAPPRTDADAGDIADDSPPTGPTAAVPAARAPRPPRGPRQRPTVRVLGFIAALIVVLGLAVAAITWYARGSYYVGLSGKPERVTIFRGRPGGFLWIDPTVEERKALTVDKLTPAQQEQLRDGQAEPTLGAARHRVVTLEQEAAAVQQQQQQATTTTQAPPTTTAP